MYVAEAPGAVGLVSITNDAPLEESIARQLARARLGQFGIRESQPPTLRHGIQNGSPVLQFSFLRSGGIDTVAIFFCRGPVERNSANLARGSTNTGRAAWCERIHRLTMQTMYSWCGGCVDGRWGTFKFTSSQILTHLVATVVWGIHTIA